MSVILPCGKRGEDILKLNCIGGDAEFNSEWLMALASAMHATMFERNVALQHRRFIFPSVIIGVASQSVIPMHLKMDAVVMVNPEILEFSQANFVGRGDA